MNAHKFQDWFANKLTIGGWPTRVNKKFELRKYGYIINVSDEYYHEDYKVMSLSGVHYFWFPMNEFKKDMGLNSIYGAIMILWQAEQDGDPVYLHCHMGSNRSWTVAAAYYFWRTGKHLEKVTRNNHINKLHQNCAEGMLPPLAEMEAFLRHFLEEWKKGQMRAGLLSMAKVSAIKNF